MYSFPCLLSRRCMPDSLANKRTQSAGPQYTLLTLFSQSNLCLPFFPTFPQSYPFIAYEVWAGPLRWVLILLFSASIFYMERKIIQWLVSFFSLFFTHVLSIQNSITLNENLFTFTQNLFTSREFVHFSGEFVHF